MREKFDVADKTKLGAAVNDAIKWLDASQEGSEEKYKEKQKGLEAISKYVFVFLQVYVLNSLVNVLLLDVYFLISS